jgi:hypothetical protein
MMAKPRAKVCWQLVLLCSLELSAASLACAQDLLNDTIDVSNFRLELRPYVTMPSNRNDIISMTTRPGDARPYITTQEGYVFVLNPNAMESFIRRTWKTGPPIPRGSTSSAIAPAVSA